MNGARFRDFPRLISLSLFFSLLLGCSGSSSDSEFITIDARKGSGTVTLPPSSTDQDYYVLPFSAPTSTPSGKSTSTLTFSSETKMAEETSSSRISKRVSLREETNIPQRLRKRFDSESTRRAADREMLEQTKKQFQDNPEFFTRFYQTRSKLTQRAQASDEIEIFSPFQDELNTSIQGVLRGSSSFALIYVDSRLNSAVTDQQVSELLAAFSSISFPRLQTLFGSPSDIDANKKVILYLADDNLFGTLELGFFRPLDLLPDGTYTGVRSNEREIVFSRAPSAENPISLIHATLAHEAFHLILFAEKSLSILQLTGGNSLIAEELFLDEGLAHLSEDLTGWGVDTGVLTKIYLDCIKHTSLAGEGSTTVDENSFCEIKGSRNDSLARRAAVMLFLLYLFQQSGETSFSSDSPSDISGAGVEFLRNLVRSDKTGIENIESAFKKSFFQMYKDFMIAVAADSSGISTSSKYRFRDEEIDPFTSLFRFIRMRTEREDLDGSTLTLTGPFIDSTPSLSVLSEDPFSFSLYSSGANVYRISIPKNLEVTFHVEASKNLGLGISFVPYP